MAEKKTEKAKKLTLPQFRKAVRNLSEGETAELLEGLYRSSPEAADYLNLRISGEEFRKAYAEEMKAKLKDCFYNKKGKARLLLDDASDLIGRFERVYPEQTGIADLKCTYIEHGTDIIKFYTRIPDSLYRGVEKMADSLVKTLNAASADGSLGSMDIAYRTRLEILAADSRNSGDYIFDFLDMTFKTIRWKKKEEASEQKSLPGTGDAPGGVEDAEASAPDALPVITDSSNVLPEEDVKLFYKLFFGLLDYVNEKKKINELRNLGLQESLDPNAVKDIARAVWQDTSLIDEFLSGPGSVLPAEEQAILRSWKRVRSGRFIIERNQKKGSVVIDMEDDSVYLVRGIITSLEEIFHYRPLPIMANADLLPFKGVIITDGLIYPLNIFMGGGVRKSLKDAYNSAKKRGQIHTSL